MESGSLDRVSRNRRPELGETAVRKMIRIRLGIFVRDLLGMRQEMEQLVRQRMEYGILDRTEDELRLARTPALLGRRIWNPTPMHMDQRKR